VRALAPGLAAALLAAAAAAAGAADLAPRVPPAERAGAVRRTNPLVPTPERLALGRELYRGKGYCAACHGLDGRGLGADVDASRLRGVLPRDFTDAGWQRVRSQGCREFVS
jgi:mono/diheme cytochrome c family protein